MEFDIEYWVHYLNTYTAQIEIIFSHLHLSRRTNRNIGHEQDHIPMNLYCDFSFFDWKLFHVYTSVFWMTHYKIRQQAHDEH